MKNAARTKLHLREFVDRILVFVEAETGVAAAIRRVVHTAGVPAHADYAHETLALQLGGRETASTIARLTALAIAPQLAGNRAAVARIERRVESWEVVNVRSPQAPTRRSLVRRRDRLLRRMEQLRLQVCELETQIASHEDHVTPGASEEKPA